MCSRCGHDYAVASCISTVYRMTLVKPVALLQVNYVNPSITHNTQQPFYGPFSGTTRMSWCQKRTSGLYGAKEYHQRQTHWPSGWVPLHPDQPVPTSSIPRFFTGPFLPPNQQRQSTEGTSTSISCKKIS